MVTSTDTVSVKDCVLEVVRSTGYEDLKEGQVLVMSEFVGGVRLLLYRWDMAKASAMVAFLAFFNFSRNDKTVSLWYYMLRLGNTELQDSIPPPDLQIVPLNYVVNCDGFDCNCNPIPTT